MPWIPVALAWPASPTGRPTRSASAANGDLFSRVIAFSPGFSPRGRDEGRTQVFVSHGTGDDVLPIDRCSRRIVPALRRGGCDVRYEEFEGGHEVSAAITAQAMAWFRNGA